jgi:CHAT domain-containing protein
MSMTRDSVDDGMLHAFEIYPMELRAQLVVLSGCNTGIGRMQYGEGMLSLARSFFIAGVRTMAYTLWPVSDKAEALLVSMFYKGIRKGLPLEDALRISKLEFLRTADPVKCHPYFWAGLVITGNTDPIHVPGKFSVYAWAGIFGVVLFAVLVRRRLIS